MSFMPMFKFASGEVCGNAQRFATEQEAARSACARFMVWTLPTDWEVHESDDPVNYAFIDGRDVMVNREVQT